MQNSDLVVKHTADIASPVCREVKFNAGKHWNREYGESIARTLAVNHACLKMFMHRVLATGWDYSKHLVYEERFLSLALKKVMQRLELGYTKRDICVPFWTGVMGSEYVRTK